MRLFYYLAGDFLDIIASEWVDGGMFYVGDIFGYGVCDYVVGDGKRHMNFGFVTSVYKCCWMAIRRW